MLGRKDPNRDWKEIGIYTDGDVGQTWQLLSPKIQLPAGFQIYGRPVDNVEETNWDDFDIMLFHGAFDSNFHKNFIVSVTTKLNPDTGKQAYACYVSASSTIAGRPVKEYGDLNWTVVRGV